MASTKIHTSESLRRDFPILDQEVYGKPRVYLDNAATSQKPQSVIDAVETYYARMNSNVHRGAHYLSNISTEALESSRDKVQKLIGANEREEIIFTKGTTEAINLVASGMTYFVKKGDNVVISALEHHSNIVPWQMLCERSGASLRVIPMTEDGKWKTGEIRNLIDQKTRIVAVNHVSNALGTRNPVEKIIEQAGKFDIPVLIDGAQSVPHMPVNVKTLNADFYCFSGHKMGAPTGTGVLYGKRSWLEKLPPYQGGGEMIKEVTFAKTTYADIPFKFEAGTPNIAGIIGLGAAVDYLQEIGMENIAQMEADLLAYLLEKMQNVPNITYYGTAQEKAAVVSFLADGCHPYDLGTLLDKMGIAVRTGHHCAQPIMDYYGIPGTVRASLAFYNTHEDIDRFIAALQRAVGMLRA